MKTVIIKDRDGNQMIKVIQKKNGTIETWVSAFCDYEDIAVRCDDNKWITGWKVVGRNNDSKRNNIKVS